MRCPCPTAAQACRSPSERGRSLSPRTRIPMPTAPLDTSKSSRPDWCRRARPSSSSESRSRASSPSCMTTCVPSLTTMRCASARCWRAGVIVEPLNLQRPELLRRERDGLQLEVDLDLLADEETAGLQRLVPLGAELLALDGHPAVEGELGLPPGILGLPQPLDGDGDRLRDVTDREVAGHGQLVAARRRDLGALEGELGKLLGIEEVGRLEVAVALLVVGRDARGVDRHLDARLRPVLFIQRQRSLPLEEPPAHLGDHHVANGEGDVGVGLVDLPGLGCHERRLLVWFGWSVAMLAAGKGSAGPERPAASCAIVPGSCSARRKRWRCSAAAPWARRSSAGSCDRGSWSPRRSSPPIAARRSRALSRKSTACGPAATTARPARRRP